MYNADFTNTQNYNQNLPTKLIFKPNTLKLIYVTEMYQFKKIDMSGVGSMCNEIDVSSCENINEIVFPDTNNLNYLGVTGCGSNLTTLNLKNMKCNGIEIRGEYLETINVSNMTIEEVKTAIGQYVNSSELKLGMTIVCKDGTYVTENENNTTSGSGPLYSATMKYSITDARGTVTDWNWNIEDANTFTCQIDGINGENSYVTLERIAEDITDPTYYNNIYCNYYDQSENIQFNMPLDEETGNMLIDQIENDFIKGLFTSGILTEYSEYKEIN